jgi:hypothetical protein
MTFSSTDLQSTQTVSHFTVIFQLFFYFKTFDRNELDSVRSVYSNTEHNFTDIDQYLFTCPDQKYIIDCHCQFDRMDLDSFLMMKFITEFSCICLRNRTRGDTNAQVSINCVDRLNVTFDFRKMIYFDYSVNDLNGYYQSRKSFFV